MAARHRRAGRMYGQRLRKTLLWTFVAFSIGAGATWFYKAQVFGFLLAPAGGQLSPFDGLPVFNSPIDMLGATISLSIRGGMVVALPVVTVGLLSLLKPLLPSRWWRFITTFVVLTMVCFLTGAAFVYYVMLPVSLGFLLNFGDEVAVPVILLSEYIELLSSLMLWIGLVFELPIAMFLLAKTRLVSYQQFKRFRKYVPPTALILAAIITPTFDGVNQVMVAIPMWILYEVGLLTAWLAHPEEGNYLWLKTIARWLGKVRSRIAWMLRRPAVMARWVRWKIWEYGSGWWWD